MAWDVDRLVALTRTFPRNQIPLSAIRELTTNRFWFGLGTIPTCRAVVEHARLIEAADLSFPIILSSDGRVMDGMHRVGKAAFVRAITSLRPLNSATIPSPITSIITQPEDLPYDDAPNQETNVASPRAAANQ